MDNLRKYTRDIEHAANFFQNHFIGKLVIYSTAKKSISIKFEEQHFLHLCGFKYQDGAKQFFKAVIERRLDWSKVTKKSDGTTDLKLKLLKSIHFIISDKVRLVNDWDIFQVLNSDKALRTNRLIFSLTLKFDDNNDMYPNSLLDLTKIHNPPAGEKVISIKSINLLDQTETVYL
ncbi:PBECR4 domain-containing protein [[Pasteurella] aerogenes]